MCGHVVTSLILEVFSTQLRTVTMVAAPLTAILKESMLLPTNESRKSNWIAEFAASLTEPLDIPALSIVNSENAVVADR